MAVVDVVVELEATLDAHIALTVLEHNRLERFGHCAVEAHKTVDVFALGKLDLDILVAG